MSQPPTIFPMRGEPGFARRLADLEEYRMFASPPPVPVPDAAAFEDRVKQTCSGFEKALYQHLMEHYLSRRSPYRSLLLFHGLGVGKTCSSITIAESLLSDHATGMPPRVLVVSPLALRKSYEEQIFSVAQFFDNDPEQMRNQCTGDTYARLVHGNPPKDAFVRRVQQLIRTRYKFVTYDSLVAFAAENPKVTDMVIIVDEAHNLRNQDTEKKAADALEDMLRNGERNRLVLLSATPMYNEPSEILWMLKLMLLNEKRKIALPTTLYSKEGRLDAKAAKVLAQLAQEYISYIRGKNPFSFAVRVPPSMSGVATAKDEWASYIEDGIVISHIGSKQKDGGVVEEAAAKRVGSSPKQLQWLNITYPSQGHGEKGFDKMFDRIGDPFPVAYRPTYANRLMPVPGRLESCAAKMARICNILRTSDGIVLIYSQFVWSGVVPMAIALEHMGFRRYGGTDLLHNPSLVPDPVSYPGTPVPQYCILSGDTNVMGSSKIEALRRAINSADNMHGQRIKVVLITPIAGEGLSFQNVREVHVLDPWYHMNRTEQVIGRAIRTCSHQNLPMEERNVTVYMHAIQGNGEKDTADMHALKIAARKWHQTKEVEGILRDNAMDCSLHYHLNYMPKEVFPMQVLMKSSQGIVFPYQYGDEPSAKPACMPVEKMGQGNGATMRTEVFASLIPTAQRRMERYIRSLLGSRLYFHAEELVAATRMRPDVAYAAIKQSVYPNAWINGHDCYLHMDGIALVPRKPLASQVQVALPQEIATKATTSDRPSNGACDAAAILRSIPPSTDPHISVLLFYMFVDSKCWPEVARYLLQNHDDPFVGTYTSLLARTGALIRRNELPRLAVSAASGPFLGYADIFQKDRLVIYIVDASAKDGFRMGSDAEVRALQAQRHVWERPSNASDLYGVLEPFRFSKALDAPLRATLKLMLPGPTVGKRRGVVCSSNKKKDLVEWLQQLGNIATGDTKEQLCFSIAIGLLREKRLLLLPEWKPPQQPI